MDIYILFQILFHYRLLQVPCEYSSLCYAVEPRHSSYFDCMNLLFLNMCLFYLIFYFLWPHRVACGILAPRPGIEPMSPAVETQSLNHWTAREGRGRNEAG